MDTDKKQILIGKLKESLLSFHKTNLALIGFSIAHLAERAVASLKLYVENPNEPEINWQNPVVELLFPIPWNFQTMREDFFTSIISLPEENSQDISKFLRTEGVLSETLAFFHFFVLRQLTKGGAFQKEADQNKSFLLPFQEKQYQNLSASEREAFLQSCLEAFPIGSGFLDVNALLSSLNENPKIPLEEKLHLLKPQPEQDSTLFFDYKDHEKIITGGFSMSIKPLVVDLDQKKAFYPITVSLIFISPETPASFPQAEREKFWNALLQIVKGCEKEWFEKVNEGSLLKEKSTQEERTILFPKKYLSQMNPVPMPRAAWKSREALQRGLGRMFSGYNQIPNIDIQGKLAQTEATRLFWNLVEEKLNQAVTEQNSLLSWYKREEAGKTILFLHGFQESKARSLWEQICKAANAGEGGAGLEIANPAFFSKNRMENGKVVIETQLTLWPEEAFKTKDGFPALPLRFRRASSPGYQTFIKLYQNKPHFADGWLWLPKGNVKEGFRLGGLSTLLFPEGRAALKSLQERQIQNYEEELNRIFTNQQPSLFR